MAYHLTGEGLRRAVPVGPPRVPVHVRGYLESCLCGFAATQEVDGRPRNLLHRDGSEVVAM